MHQQVQIWQVSICLGFREYASRIGNVFAVFCVKYLELYSVDCARKGAKKKIIIHFENLQMNASTVWIFGKDEMPNGAIYTTESTASRDKTTRTMWNCMRFMIWYTPISRNNRAKPERFPWLWTKFTGWTMCGFHTSVITVPQTNYTARDMFESFLLARILCSVMRQRVRHCLNGNFSVNVINTKCCWALFPRPDSSLYLNNTENTIISVAMLECCFSLNLIQFL